ncbi:hypothetical protein FRC10_009936 [Ceratobasidium sp. 414]|nr:hypothetical protein FRC10_009936 [Ceratobasidium sp. 414]
MSDALGKPWIESAITTILVDHAHELPSPPKLQGRAQIVKFLTFREDYGDGRQPSDRNTELWAEITDRQWIIPVRIANEATNKIEDEQRRALTYFRRGFFTFKASVTYNFVAEQVSLPGGGSRVQQSNRKSLVLNIVELHYISGGGPGAPVATNSVTLQTCPALRDWESALSIGGQTLINKQRLARDALQAARASKTSSRRIASNSAGRTRNKALAKTSVPVLPHQSSSADKLSAFREWQDAFWGNRHPSAPDRPDDLPSFRSSQIHTSTPLDAQRRPSSPSEPYAPYNLEEGRPGGSLGNPNLGDSAEYKDGGDKPELSQGRRAHSPDSDEGSSAGSSAASEVDEAPDMDARVKRDRQLSSRPGAGSEKSLDTDDATSEKILSLPTTVRVFSPLRVADHWLTVMSQNDTAPESGPLLEKHVPLRQPIVLVPDSDPMGSSQARSQPSYARGSSPWDIENSPPWQLRGDQRSPEVAKLSSNKGKRRYSPTLSSPLQPSSSLPNPSQILGQSNDPQKTSTGSGQDNSQESAAAASLPSPPPEHPPTQPTPSQPHTRFSPSITNEPATHGQHSGNAQAPESSDTMPRAGPGVRPNPNPRKRRRSPSRVRDGGLTLASRGGVAIVARDPEIEAAKRRRLDDSSSRLTQERAVAREDISEMRVPQTDNTNDGETNANRPDLSAPNPQDEGVPPPKPRAAPPPDPTIPQGVIPHDHDAWSAPSYRTARPKTPAKPGNSAKGDIPNPSGTTSVSSSVTPLPGPLGRQAPDKPRFALPSLARSLARRAVSPEYPQVTASQVADADEDVEMQPLPAVKVEPPTPARPTKSRASILSTVPSRPRSSISYAGSGSTKETPALVLPKVSRTSRATGTQEGQPRSTDTDVGSSAVAKSRPKDKARPSKPRASGNDTRNAATNGGKSTKESIGDSGSRRKLLGGFKPTVLPSLEDRFISTWGMWLESVHEAESFWQEEDPL